LQAGYHAFDQAVAAASADPVAQLVGGEVSRPSRLCNATEPAPARYYLIEKRTLTVFFVGERDRCTAFAGPFLRHQRVLLPPPPVNLVFSVPFRIAHAWWHRRLTGPCHGRS
jgi:hypothetical protein